GLGGISPRIRHRPGTGDDPEVTGSPGLSSRSPEPPAEHPASRPAHPGPPSREEPSPTRNPPRKKPAHNGTRPRKPAPQRNRAHNQPHLRRQGHAGVRGVVPRKGTASPAKPPRGR